MHRLLLSLLLAPAALGAQTAADAALCERIVSPPVGRARASAEQHAQSGGARGSFFVGCLALADERFDDAAGAFERVTRADDRSAVAHYWLGRAYGAQARSASLLSQVSLAQKTRREMERAVELDPGHLDARQVLVEYYWQAPAVVGGSRAKARAQVEEIRRLAPYRGGMLAGQLETRDTNWVAAIQQYRQLTEQFSDSATPWLSLAQAFARQKRWQDAFAAVDRMLKAAPASMTAQYTLGRFAAESGEQLDRGEQALRRYLAYRPEPGEPSLANAHWRLGAIHDRRGQTDAARAEYEAALALDPKHASARSALAKLR